MNQTIGNNRIRQLQKIFLMQRFIVYLLVLKYLAKINALYRLTQATLPSSIPPYQGDRGGGVNPSSSYTISYSYDPTGNRTTETSSDGTTNYSYSANKLTSSTGTKAYSFTYDSNGNTISENNRQYIYNQNQRLIKVTDTRTDTGMAVLGEYVYNANGQRVKKVVDGKTTYFIYDQYGNLIEETDENGNIISDYVYLGSIPIARVDEWWEDMETPQAPTGLTIIPGDKQLTVTWNSVTDTDTDTDTVTRIDGYNSGCR